MSALAAEVRPSAQDTDDLDLVRAIRAGDDRAFELVYERYQPRIALYIRGMVHDDGRAEDVTQEVFFSALRRMRATDCEILLKPWLYEIAKNACIDAFRRSRSTNEVSFDAHEALSADVRGRLADTRATPDVAVNAKLDLDNLRGAFGGLSQTHHQILVLRELEGLSYRDIGERLGMSHAAVESTLFRARRRLEVEYEELVSGKRCIRVRGIVDAGGRASGVRDQRRMDRHVSHCQPCRRYALMAGVDLDVGSARPRIAARIAALLPLPSLWRRSDVEETPTQVLGSGGHATAAHWSANVVSTVDPGTLWGWGKAVAAAATVAVAGVGAGAAISERGGARDLLSRAPAIAGVGGSGDRHQNEGPARREGAASGPVKLWRGALGGRRGTPQSPGGASPARDGAAPGSGAEPAPGSQAKPRPAGSGGATGSSSGGAGSSASSGAASGASSDSHGSGGQSSASGAGNAPNLSPTIHGVTQQLQSTLGDVTGAAANTANGALGPGGLVPGIAAPVLQAVQDTLGGT